MFKFLSAEQFLFSSPDLIFPSVFQCVDSEHCCYCYTDKESKSLPQGSMLHRDSYQLLHLLLLMSTLLPLPKITSE